MGAFEAGWHRSNLKKHPIRTKNLLGYGDGHGIADDLNQLAIRIGLANQDPGVTTPTQGKSCSVMKDCIRVPRAFDVEVHVALERCSHLPV